MTGRARSYGGRGIGLADAWKEGDNFDRRFAREKGSKLEILDSYSRKVCKAAAS
jgi:hypothetical protein